MAIEIEDVLKSGDIDDIVLGNNIQFVQASGAEAENTFMRIGAGGLISLYRAPDQDIHWSGENIFNIPLSTTEQTLVGLTVTEDIAALDGSFSLSGSVTNSSHNKDVVLTLSVYDDDIFVGSEHITITANESNKLFLFSGPLHADIVGGSAITARFTADDDGELTLNGASTPSKFTITKAQAAPVNAVTPGNVATVIANNDFSQVLTTTANLGPSLSEIEIVGVLADNGITSLDRNTRFKILDANERLFLITYIHNIDKFYYERFTEAT